MNATGSQLITKAARQVCAVRELLDTAPDPLTAVTRYAKFHWGKVYASEVTAWGSPQRGYVAGYAHAMELIILLVSDLRASSEDG